jgi:hypothetical protein
MIKQMIILYFLLFHKYETILNVQEYYVHIKCKYKSFLGNHLNAQLVLYKVKKILHIVYS